MFLPHVANTDDFDVCSFHSVNHKVDFVRDEFASSGDAPRSADAWKVSLDVRLLAKSLDES